MQRPFGVIQPSSRELTPQAFGVYNQSVYNNSLAQKQRVANVGVTTAAEVAPDARQVVSLRTPSTFNRHTVPGA